MTDGLKQVPHEQYRGYRRAGVRFSEDLSQELNSGREASERQFLAAYHMYDKAHVTVLGESGSIPRDVARMILTALRGLEQDDIEEVRTRIGGGMHSGELFLIRTLGEDIGGWAHLARSSGDLGAVGERVAMRSRLLDTAEALSGLCETLVSVGIREAETIWPAYLHDQQIEPMTLGHYCSALVQGFLRDLDRAVEAYPRLNRSPAGAMVLSGSGFATSSERLSELMGFDRPADNFLDAFRDWDHVRDCFFVLASIASHLAILGEDLSIWMGSDQRFIDLADRYVGGSSALMQIRSSIPPNLVKGALSQVLGGMVTAFVNDLAPTHGALFQRRYAMPQLDQAFDTVLNGLRLLPPVLTSASIDRERAVARVKASFATAGDLAALLVEERQLPWRTAHQICGILFRHLDEKAVVSGPIRSADINHAAIEYFGRSLDLPQKRIDAAFDPRKYVERRTAPGGSAPSEVLRQLAAAHQMLERKRAWVEDGRARIAAAGDNLEQAIDALIEP